MTVTAPYPAPIELLQALWRNGNIQQREKKQSYFRDWSSITGRGEGLLKNDMGGGGGGASEV